MTYSQQYNKQYSKHGSTRSGILEIDSVDSMILPKGTTAERNVTTNPLLRYNTDTNNFEGYNGSGKFTQRLQDNDGILKLHLN